MKKLALIIIILLLTGCNDTSNLEPTNEIVEDNNNNIVDEVEEPEYVDTNPVVIGLYLYTNSWTDRTLLKEYTTDFVVNQDIISAEAFLTNEEAIAGTTFQTKWLEYYNNYEDNSKYKIGYEVSFTTTDGEISKTILTPADTASIYGYIQVYLYDDVHQEIGAWYSHITEEEMNDDSLLTSIKLTGSTNIDDVISDINLKAFTYDTPDDFDSDGKYRGNSYYEFKIKRK